MNMKNILENPYTGFLKGNMFKDLYSQYKNYNITELIPNNEQAELLLNINQLEFASHELRLYLDVYPNDQEYINRFNELRKKCNELINIYESKYGPLLYSDLSNVNMFEWEYTKFPWEMEDK